MKERTADFGVISNEYLHVSKKDMLDVYRKICNTRNFELNVLDKFKDGSIELMYSSIGQESISAAVSTVFKDCLIFAQHRAHSVYLSFGGSPEKLRDELFGLSTGCSEGMGGSPSIQDRSIGMIGHDGLIGSNVPFGVGAALGSGKKVVCFFGDGAAEEDYILPAMGFAVTHKLPVLFICEDNDLSILTPKKDRRSWKMVDVVNAMGIPSFDLSDDPWTIMKHIQMESLPLFLNVRTCRHYWHTGAGCDGEAEWNRMSIVGSQILSRGLLSKQEMIKFQQKIEDEMGELWAKQ